MQYLHDVFGEVRKLSHMNTEALVTDAYERFNDCSASQERQQSRTWLNLVQQCDVAIMSVVIRIGHMRDDMQVLDVRNLLVQRSQLVEMCSKEAESMNFRGDVSVILI